MRTKIIVKITTIFALLLSAVSIFAGDVLTELSNANQQQCIHALSQYPNAVVVWQYEGCPFAIEAQNALVKAKVHHHTDMSDVQLFYFNGKYESMYKNTMQDTDHCSDPSLTVDQKKWCETARVCLQMSDPDPLDTGSPTVLFYQSGNKTSVYDSASKSGNPWTEDDLYQWMEKNKS